MGIVASRLTVVGLLVGLAACGGLGGEPEEHAVARIEGARLIPLKTLPDELGSLPLLINMLRAEDATIHYEAVGVVGNLVHSSPAIKRRGTASRDTFSVNAQLHPDPLAGRRRRPDAG